MISDFLNYSCIITDKELTEYYDDIFENLIIQFINQYHDNKSKVRIVLEIKKYMSQYVDYYFENKEITEKYIIDYIKYSNMVYIKHNETSVKNYKTIIKLDRNTTEECMNLTELIMILRTKDKIYYVNSVPTKFKISTIYKFNNAIKGHDFEKFEFPVISNPITVIINLIYTDLKDYITFDRCDKNLDLSIYNALREVFKPPTKKRKLIRLNANSN